jgi:hypothetical protein
MHTLHTVFYPVAVGVGARNVGTSPAMCTAVWDTHLTDYDNKSMISGGKFSGTIR